MMEPEKSKCWSDVEDPCNLQRVVFTITYLLFESILLQLS